MGLNLIDYEFGFRLALIFTGFIALTPLTQFFKNFKYLLKLNYFFVGVYITLITALSTFILTYPILNTIGNIGVLIESISSNSEKTIEFIILRFSSVLIGFKLFLSCIKFNHKWFQLLHFKKKSDDGQPVLDMYDTQGTAFVEWTNISQMGIYIVLAFSLMLSGYLNNDTKILISIINAALFFIVDDWNIIHDYSKVYKKTILKMHNLRIHGLNAILSTSGVIASILYFNWEVAILNCILILLSLYWKYIYKIETLFSKLKLLGNTYTKDDMHFLDDKTALINLKEHHKSE